MPLPQILTLFNYSFNMLLKMDNVTNKFNLSNRTFIITISLRCYVGSHTKHNENTACWHVIILYDRCDVTYLLTAIGLTPGSSSTVHIYTQTVHKTIQLTTHRTTQLTTNWEECGPCPVFASYILVFALQLRKNKLKPQSGQPKSASWLFILYKGLVKD
jgi:hypothetical protein